MKITALTVSRDQAGGSLQDFLAEALDVSRNRAKAIIDARNVFVNRRRVWMARHPLAAGDKIEITQSPNDSADAGKLPILFQDDHYLIIDKPAGMLSNGTNSAESILREQRSTPQILAVHRLDRDTSGCLLLAKTSDAADKAIPLFRQHSVDKTYHVIARGQIAPPEQTITVPIEGQRAVTRLKTISSNQNASHLLARIETGRTHQIRKHLVSIGNPILGDSYYGVRTQATRRSLAATRQMLHASTIEFTNPISGRRIKASAPLPPDFRDCLRVFRLT